MKVIAICLLIFSCLWSVFTLAAPFDTARLAAEEGRFEDVISVLSEMIQAGELDEQDKVIAYSNRGIAYTLQGSYQLARQDLNEAIQLDPEHSLTQNQLGIIAEHVDSDIPAAVKWYERAAEQGFAPAQTNLGDLYLIGKASTGVRGEDYALAQGWYSKAVAQDYMLARVSLAVMYRDGLGTAADPDMAVKLFTQAAKDGSVQAHYFLGKAMESGEGIRRDYAGAAMHYQTAAERGDARAQNALGYLYRRGKGVQRSYETAVHWYRLATANGNVEAINRLAWILATCPEQRFCDGDEAVKLATTAVEQNATAGYLDTLAAAHARNGNFAEAIHIVESFLETLDPGSDSYRRYKGRLDLYRTEQPFQSD